MLHSLCLTCGKPRQPADQPTHNHPTAQHPPPNPDNPKSTLIRGSTPPTYRRNPNLLYLEELDERHYLLIRRNRDTTEMAFHYC